MQTRIFLFLLSILVVSSFEGYTQSSPVEKRLYIGLGTEHGFKYHSSNQTLQNLGEAPAFGTSEAKPGYGLNLAYMRRIPDVRTYWGPKLEANYHQWNSSIEKGDVISGALSLNMRSFIFDLEGDCDCPTWKKEPFLKKAFFAEIGLGFASQLFNNANSSNTNLRYGVFTNIGIGIDQKISKKLSVYGLFKFISIFSSKKVLNHQTHYLRPEIGISYKL